MKRSEIIEWVIILLAVLLWWPRIFLGYDPRWYHLLIYYVVPLVLLIIFIRRYRRMKEGLAYSKEMIHSQKTGRPGPPLDPRS